MKVLAISASARKNRMVHNGIKELLKDIKSECEIISLSQKRINGCIGCTACAKDNQCKVKDDWNEIGEKMKEADVIIFGAPNYYGMINALGHATLERTFCFRHRDEFLLKDKLGVALATCTNQTDENPVINYIEKMFASAKMKTIANVKVNQYNQCYTCGFGKDCLSGSVVGRHGVLDEILPCHLPLELQEQEETLKEIKAARDILISHGVEFN